MPPYYNKVLIFKIQGQHKHESNGVFSFEKKLLQAVYLFFIRLQQTLFLEVR